MTTPTHTRIDDLPPLPRRTRFSEEALPLIGLAFLRQVTTGGTSTSPNQSEEDNAAGHAKTA
jgi:hypothetical protein